MWKWFKGKEESNFVSEITKMSTLFWDLAMLSLWNPSSWETSHADEHFCCSKSVLSRF